MSGLVEVLAAHGWNMPGPTTCKCGWDSGGSEFWYRELHEHIAKAVLAHLRAVAADEGVRERVGRAIADGYEGDWSVEAEDALDAFLAHLDAARPSDPGRGEVSDG